MKERLDENLLVNDEINFLELIQILWSNKKLILIVTSFFGIASILIALSLPSKYTSEVLLTPAIKSSQGNSLLDQYGGFASMAGIELPDGEASKKDIALEILNSRNFITNFINKRDILVDLMASVDWDPSTNELIIDEDIYDVKSKKWVREVSYPYTSKPSYQEAYEHWHKNIFVISKDKDKGFVKLSITHYSPFIAKNWLLWIVEDLNDHVRKNDIDESTKSLEYLYQELERVNYDELNTLLYNLIEEDIKVLSIANTKEEYIFKIIDPAIVPQEKSYPSRALICIIITFIGGIFICLYVLCRHYISPKKLNNSKTN
jgi:hypothetical protein